MRDMIMSERCSMSNGSRSEADMRQERRAAALRENLRRRKAQARAQSAAAAGTQATELTPAPPSDPAPDPGETQGN
jgi:hypothetical protein